MAVHRRVPSFIHVAVAALAISACSGASSTQPGIGRLSPISRDAVEGDLDPITVGAVYTSTNAADGNSIIAFRRGTDGTLSRIGSFATGGLGVGGAVDPLASQFAVVLSGQHDALFVVNAGSNQVSSFRVERNGALELASVLSSGGERPVSIAVHERVLYVLNNGDNVLAGFRIGPDARLEPITKGSRRSLAPGANGAAAVRFTADGRQLVVAERLSNRLEVFPVHRSGRLGKPIVGTASGGASFGFDITTRNQAIVSETQGSLSSYSLSSSGALTPITQSISTGGVAPRGVAACIVLQADIVHAPVAVPNHDRIRRALRATGTRNRNLVDPLGAAPSRLEVEENVVSRTKCDVRGIFVPR